MPLNIPRLPRNLHIPVRALACSAWVFRGAFTAAAEGRPATELLHEFATQLELADRVLDRWAEHLGLTDDPQAGPAGADPTDGVGPDFPF